MTCFMRVGLVAVMMVLPVAATDAGIRSKALQEALEFAGKRFGKEVAEEGVERLSSRMMQLAARHGDDVVATALKKVGPRAGKVASEAGEHGGVALRLMARHGDDALPLVTKTASLKAIAQYGDEAATAFLRHGSVAESLVGQFAKEGAEALANVTPQNGRRLAMLATEGRLNAELLTVVRRYGDEACEFIWRNKGALATAAVLTTFVASPEPYLHGAEKLTATVAEAAVQPLAKVPEAIAVKAADGTNWNAVWIVLGVVVGMIGWMVVRECKSVSSAIGIRRPVNRADESSSRN